MSPTIEEAVPDIAVGAVSVAVLVAYHVWLYIKVQQHPEQTVFGISSAARRIWIASIMYRKEEILAVQTLRNYIMATSLLATTSVGLIFGLTAFLSNIGKSGDGGSSSSSSGLFAFTSNNLFGIKIILFILAQVGAFFSLSQSLRFYNHVCITVNTNITQEELARLRPSAVIAYTHLDANRVGDMLNRAAFFYTLAMRMYYVSVPLLGWFAGPAGLGVTTGLLVCVLRVIDVNWDSDGYVALDGSGPGDVEAGAGAGAGAGGGGTGGDGASVTSSIAGGVVGRSIVKPKNLEFIKREPGSIASAIGLGAVTGASAGASGTRGRANEIAMVQVDSQADLIGGHPGGDGHSRHESAVDAATAATQRKHAAHMLDI